MIAAGTVGMCTSSRLTARSIGPGYPTRLNVTLTDEPFGPRSLRTACSVVHPLVASPSILAITSPRRSDQGMEDRKSTRLNSSHLGISYAVFCLKKKNKTKYNAHNQSV